MLFLSKLAMSKLVNYNLLENFQKLESLKENFILIEYPLLRLSKRLDTIIIIKNFVIYLFKGNIFSFIFTIVRYIHNL